MTARVRTCGNLLIARFERALVVVDRRFFVFHELLGDAVPAFDMLTDEHVSLPGDADSAAAIREAVRVVGKYVLEGAGSTVPSPKGVDVGGRLLLRSHAASVRWGKDREDGAGRDGAAVVQGVLLHGRAGVRLVLGEDRPLAMLAAHRRAAGDESVHRGPCRITRGGRTVFCSADAARVTVGPEDELVELWAASGPSPEPLKVANLTPSATLARFLVASPQRPDVEELETLARAAERVRAHRVEFPDEDAFFATALERAGEGGL